VTHPIDLAVASGALHDDELSLEERAHLLGLLELERQERAQRVDAKQAERWNRNVRLKRRLEGGIR
jgi:hypothetical protein